MGLFINYLSLFYVVILRIIVIVESAFDRDSIHPDRSGISISSYEICLNYFKLYLLISSNFNATE